MPVYEYRCRECGEIHEELRLVAAMDNEAVCDKCSGIAELVMSTPGRFRRGPGWHARMAVDNVGMPGEV